MLRVTLACVVMAVLLWWMASSLEVWLAYPQWERLLRCLAGISLSAMVYFIVLYVLGVRVSDLRSRVSA